MQQLVGALTVGNVWLMAINLLPIPPLDGAEAWPLFPLLWRHVRDGRRRRRRARATRSTLRTLERLDALDEGDVPPSPEKKAAVDKILADLKRPPARTSRE
ncbi:MAG TPA: hypothetical protein VHE35_26940 [Kofleriaceae bacterium]|nr:hypothetical protein [Kofleriaceae bacterium]